jgi:replicative DNA helicase
VTVPTTDPGRVLVGAALHGALGVLDVIRDDDLADPRLRVVAGVIRQLAEAGVASDPTTVLAHAQATGTVTGAEAVRGFALLLTELYAGCPTPASARWYAAAALGAAVRRRCQELSTRIGQAAEAESLESLLTLVDAEAKAVRELADRRAAIAGEGAPTQLRAVGA